MPADVLLEVRDLTITLPTGRGASVRIIENISFTIGRREILGLVGESGSGKSMTALALMGLVDAPGAVITGSARYLGRELVGLKPRAMRALRGTEIAMIFQDPMTAMTPVYTIGWQIEEQLRAHQKLSHKAARARAPSNCWAKWASPTPGARGDALPAPAFGRHAPARDDRDGAVLQPVPAYRRRADHGARRDRAGADPATSCVELQRRPRAPRCCSSRTIIGVVAATCDRTVVQRDVRGRGGGAAPDRSRAVRRSHRIPTPPGCSTASRRCVPIRPRRNRPRPEACGRARPSAAPAVRSHDRAAASSTRAARRVPPLIAWQSHAIACVLRRIDGRPLRQLTPVASLLLSTWTA